MKVGAAETEVAPAARPATTRPRRPPGRRGPEGAMTMPKRSDSKKDRRDEPGEMPSTVARSDKKAQRTWKETHDSAVETYGEGERAHRTAFASLKHSYEKRGDRWVPKKEKGPSDPRSSMPTSEAHAGKGKTFGGIDYNGHTKKEFEQRARELGITGYSRMRKEELVEAIEKREKSIEARERRSKAA
jgi:hypothetical protein